MGRDGVRIRSYCCIFDRRKRIILLAIILDLHTTSAGSDRGLAGIIYPLQSM